METELVPAVDRTARILMAFKSGQDELGVSELSKSLGINKSTVHKTVSTLCYYGFLYRNDDSKRYRLGHTLFELGNMALDGIDLRVVARPYLRRLVIATGQKNSITDVDQLKAEQTKAREQGFAMDDEEYLEGVRAVSVPIFGAGQSLLASVTVVGFAAKMPDDRMLPMIDETVKVCGEISLRMGHAPRRNRDRQMMNANL